MRSPWKAGSISLRWRMCSSPSSSRSECGPRVGRRISFASPALVRCGPAVKTVRTSAGSPSMTHGIGSMRAVKTSPKRARWRAGYVVGRNSHSAICPSCRVRGPGGSPDAFMNASVHSGAMPAPATATAEEIRSVNTRYHDGAAAGYDAKWGIDYGEVGRHQVLTKVAKALGAAGPFGRSLEVGAGTGYFSLNMLQAGFVGDAVCTDISPGMLEALQANARRLDLDVATVACDAEELPFEDDSFDLIFGHAVLHHLPDLDRAFGEFRRVLAPGGMLLFAGEPSRHGDRIAAVPNRAAVRLAPAWRRVFGVSPAPTGGSGDENEHALEGMVDVHAFVPADLERFA